MVSRSASIHQGDLTCQIILTPPTRAFILLLRSRAIRKRDHPRSGICCNVIYRLHVFGYDTANLVPAPKSPTATLGKTEKFFAHIYGI